MTIHDNSYFLVTAFKVFLKISNKYGCHLKIIPIYGYFTKNISERINSLLHTLKTSKQTNKK